MTGAARRDDELRLARSLQDRGPQMTEALRRRVLIAHARGWSPRMIAGVSGCRLEEITAVVAADVTPASDGQPQ